MQYHKLKPRILECTLRDGSYAINFQFTKEDTRNIVRALDEVGFELIEIGHGMGLGASEKNKGIAAESDETYIKVTAETVKNAQWGMFCIPGIAQLHHIDMAADYGMKFIRIGTNVEDFKDSQLYIERAKKHGMFVCSNFMKSYVSDPRDFAKYSLEVEKYGSDLVYIVDSAGGMFPEDIEKYVNEIRTISPTLRMGFHGHNNLGMGVANSLRAIELGVEIIDSSLQGFGRSAGNTPTEQLLCALLRKDMSINVDPIYVMDIAERYIQPLIQAKGISSVDIVSGFSLFHSSYMPTIEKYATQYRVDPRRLIVSVCSLDKANASHELVEQQAKILAESGVHGNWKPLFKVYYGGEQEKVAC